MPAKGQRIAPRRRFWAHVETGNPNECWEWVGAKNHKGYGMFRWNPEKNATGAHRASYKLANGEIPKGLHVLHSCDNPACVNPAHLRAGTNKENMRDKLLSGNMPRGEASGRSKLSRKDVNIIRRLYATGDYTQNGLASLFNISRTNIGYIVRGDSWKHLLGG